MYRQYWKCYTNLRWASQRIISRRDLHSSSYFQFKSLVWRLYWTLGFQTSLVSPSIVHVSSLLMSTKGNIAALLLHHCSFSRFDSYVNDAIRLADTYLFDSLPITSRESTTILMLLRLSDPASYTFRKVVKNASDSREPRWSMTDRYFESRFFYLVIS